MDKRAIFDAWAPLQSPWSRWAKPAVFAHLPMQGETPLAPSRADLASYPRSEDRRALVVNLPGAESVAVALGLARAGYRPVPLFNSCPPDVDDCLRIIGVAVDVRAIMHGLSATAPLLAALDLPSDAPPVFLLDARRSAPGVSITERMFDNRSVVFGADFPSATFLRQRNILGAHVVHDPALPFGEDLRYALRHWHADGIAVACATPGGEPLEIEWPSDGWFGELFERARAFLTLRRNPRGGFGGFGPEVSGG